MFACLVQQEDPSLSENWTSILPSKDQQVSPWLDSDHGLFVFPPSCIDLIGVGSSFAFKSDYANGRKRSSARSAPHFYLPNSMEI